MKNAWKKRSGKVSMMKRARMGISGLQIVITEPYLLCD
jgi:hypothetical protein